MAAHWSLDIAPVPESVSRSIRTSSAWRLNRLYPAASSAASRCSTVERRMGSTEWIRNGSMIVRQRSTSRGYGGKLRAWELRGFEPSAAELPVHPAAREAMTKQLAQSVGHVPGATGDIWASVDDASRHGPAVVAERHDRAAGQ